MKISFDEYNEAVSSYAGYCTSCDEITEWSGVEPDAEGYECPECGEDILMGVEQAMICGYLEFEEDE